MNIEKKDERNLIQILRGIAILLVVLHHVMNRYPLSLGEKTALSIINSVHVVVFFVISGWLFEKKKDSYVKKGLFVYFKRKFLQLMVPYFCFSISFALLIKLATHIGALKNIVLYYVDVKIKSIPQIFLDVLFYHDVYFESLWFVYVLFILMILMFLLNNKKFVSLPFVIGTLLFTTLLKSYGWMFFDLESLTILNSVIMYFPWIICGRYLYINLHSGFKIKQWMITAATAVLLACVIRYYFVDLSWFMGVYISALWKGIEIFAIRVSFIVLATSFSKWLIMKDKFSIIKYIGDNSYSIYLIHNPWLVSPFSVLLKFDLPFVLKTIVITLLVVTVSCLLTSFLKKFFKPFYRVYFGEMGHKSLDENTKSNLKA